MMRGEAQREGKGSAAILSALSTVLLAMVLRSAKGAATTTALWTAVADPRIAKTIESVLTKPAAPVGSFLTRVRVMAAAELLNAGDATVATIAGQVGYQSESAFSRAFRAEVGTTPARFRRNQQRRWLESATAGD